MHSPFDLWAKTKKGSAEWHALPYHLIDVGCSAEALWDTLSVGLKDHVGRWLGLDHARAAATLAFLAAAHDVGKANPYFQAKALNHRERLKHWELIQATENQPHGQATYALLRAWLRKRTELNQRTSTGVSAAVGAHHGTFFSDSGLATLGVSEDPWGGTAHELLEWMARLFPPQFNSLSRHDETAFVGWLAGFVSVADWIGSNERMVVFESRERDITAYCNEARHRARDVMRDLGFDCPERGHVLRAQDLLSTTTIPNDLQRTASELCVKQPRLTIIEAPTGEGKTEAALMLAERHRADGRGLFFALPTMATANGMVDRIGLYLHQVYPDTTKYLRLLHGMAWLVERPGGKVGDPEDQDESAEVADWFAGSKRGLLDWFGVGTIDQLLLAGLRSKHFFVRLFGLSGKTIIIDEVHAYDDYMTEILLTVLSWLRALDCQVILLSATLPSAKRKQLLQAWGVEPVVESPYPRITTVCEQQGLQSRPVTASTRKPLHIRPLAVDGENPLAVAMDHLLELALSTGGFAVLVVNSVKHAQEAYRIALAHHGAAVVEVSLFHARYTRQDRMNKEQKVMQQFGKLATRGTPRLLIATQVVEQSLDLDFDYMVSELAPIDLLIQRAGRLHRHLRDEKGALLGSGQSDLRPNPVLQVLVKHADPVEVGQEHKSVYAPAVIEATRNWLGKGRTIAQPADVEGAVEAVYAQSELHDGQQAIELKAIRHAERVTIPLPNAAVHNLVAVNRLSEDVEGHDHALRAHTRLEELASMEITIWPHATPLPAVPYQPDAIRNLVLNSVRVSVPRHILTEFQSLPELPDARTIRVLREARHCPIDQENSFETPTYRIRYSSEMGLTWEQRDGELST
ncbi:MAG: CRISPR-associated helicase Cas3' [Fimbriimonadaceae bacterium]|nr:CRISPR-associated helicase Cas3' [Fimbriimonadaceae bacterium]